VAFREPPEVLDRGGHLPMYEAPDLLIDDIRAYVRSGR
jgi:hypothetical protein